VLRTLHEEMRRRACRIRSWKVTASALARVQCGKAALPARRQNGLVTLIAPRHWDAPNRVRSGRKQR